jgi:hypothetical protein
MRQVGPFQIDEANFQVRDGNNVLSRHATFLAAEDFALRANADANAVIELISSSVNIVSATATEKEGPCDNRAGARHRA